MIAIKSLELQNNQDLLHDSRALARENPIVWHSKVVSPLASCLQPVKFNHFLLDSHHLEIYLLQLAYPTWKLNRHKY